MKNEKKSFDYYVARISNGYELACNADCRDEDHLFYGYDCAFQSWIYIENRIVNSVKWNNRNMFFALVFLGHLATPKEFYLILLIKNNIDISNEIFDYLTTNTDISERNLASYVHSKPGIIEIIQKRYFLRRTRLWTREIRCLK